MPTIISSRNCKAPCGGTIEWLDHGEGFEDRYEVRHFPSGNNVLLQVRAQAKRLVVALSNGEDEIGLLPQTTHAHVQEVLPSITSPTQDQVIEEAISEESSHARAQVKENPPETVSLSSPKSLEEQSVALSGALDEHFPWSRVIGEIESLLSAQDVHVTKSGQAVASPNWHARATGIRLLIECKAGRPFSRPEPKTVKRLDTSGFKDRVRKSASFGNAIKSMIEEVEEETSL